MRAATSSLTVACLLVASLAGCDRSGQSSAANRQGQSVVGAVAVIDLDAVAQRLGRDKQMAESLQQFQAALNEQLATIKVSYEKEVAEKQTQFGKTPSPEQVQFLSNMSQRASSDLGRVRQKATNDLTQHRQELVRRFREEVKPIARQLASERGLSIIVTKNENVVFDFAPAVDITEDVIRRMQERQRERPAQPGPG